MSLQLELPFSASRVFIPQPKARKVNHQWVVDMDLRDANRYGNCVVLTDVGTFIGELASFAGRYRAALSDFSDSDYLICSGDPTLIALAFHYAAMANGGKVNLLRWDRIKEQYVVLKVQP